MKKLFTLWLGLYSLSLLAFSGPSDSLSLTPADTSVFEPSPKFRIGVHFAPEACYRNVSNQNGNYLNEPVIDARNNSEVEKFGATFGVVAYYQFKSYVAFEGGLYYAQRGYQSKRTFVQPGSTSQDIKRTNYNFHYMEIPLRVQFTVGKKKLQFVAGTGFTPAFLLTQTQSEVVEYPNGDRKRNRTNFSDKFNKFNLWYTLTAGADYQIKPGMNLRLEPTFRYGCIRVDDADLSTRLWSIGFNFGFYYGLPLTTGKTN